jgi:hypothetical protein
MEQTSYVRISSESHPFCVGKNITHSDINIPCINDHKIIEEIIEYNKLLGLEDVGGEWKYLNEIKRKTYIDALINNDGEKMLDLFTNFFQTSCGYGIMTPSFSEINQYDLKSQILWDLDALFEFGEMDFEDDILYSPPVGAPYGLNIDDKIISPDSPRHLYFAQKLLKFNTDILEIGGGYGGLIYFLKKLGFNNIYFNVDLPETLYIAYYFLRKNNINCVLVTGENFQIEKGTVYLIPHFLLNKIQEKIHFDTFFNANSLSEMDINYVNQYFNIINKKKPKYILHSNSNFLVFPNSERHIEVLGKNFPIDDLNYNKIYQCISPFQGASGRYREFYYEKI